jgi:hypothetical protein
MRTRRFTCTVAVFAVLAAGCGGADSGGVSADAVAWADQVCGALTGFTRAATAGPGVDVADPVAATQGMSQYLGSTAEELERSLTALEAVGPSPVEGGDEYVARLSEALTGIRAGFEAARTQLDNIDTSDMKGFATAYPAAIAPLQELRNLPDPTEGLRSNEELRAASEQAQNCRELREMGAPAS